MINTVNLRMFRHNMNLTQKALAELVGIKEATYRKIEGGNMQPGMEVLSNIIRELNLQKANIEDLIVIK